MSGVAINRIPGHVEKAGGGPDIISDAEVRAFMHHRRNGACPPTGQHALSSAEHNFETIKLGGFPSSDASVATDAKFSPQHTARSTPNLLSFLKFEKGSSHLNNGDSSHNCGANLDEISAVGDIQTKTLGNVITRTRSFGDAIGKPVPCSNGLPGSAVQYGLNGIYQPGLNGARSLNRLSNGSLTDSLVSSSNGSVYKLEPMSLQSQSSSCKGVQYQRSDSIEDAPSSLAYRNTKTQPMRSQSSRHCAISNKQHSGRSDSTDLELRFPGLVPLATSELKSSSSTYSTVPHHFQAPFLSAPRMASSSIDESLTDIPLGSNCPSESNYRYSGGGSNNSDHEVDLGDFGSDTTGNEEKTETISKAWQMTGLLQAVTALSPAPSPNELTSPNSFCEQFSETSFDADDYSSNNNNNNNRNSGLDDEAFGETNAEDGDDVFDPNLPLTLPNVEDGLSSGGELDSPRPSPVNSASVNGAAGTRRQPTAVNEQSKSQLTVASFSDSDDEFRNVMASRYGSSAVPEQDNGLLNPRLMRAINKDIKDIKRVIAENQDLPPVLRRYSSSASNNSATSSEVHPTRKKYTSQRRPPQFTDFHLSSGRVYASPPLSSDAGCDSNVNRSWSGLDSSTRGPLPLNLSTNSVSPSNSSSDPPSNYRSVATGKLVNPVSSPVSAGASSSLVVESNNKIPPKQPAKWLLQSSPSDSLQDSGPRDDSSESMSPTNHKTSGLGKSRPHSFSSADRVSAKHRRRKQNQLSRSMSHGKADSYGPISGIPNNSNTNTEQTGKCWTFPEPPPVVFSSDDDSDRDTYTLSRPVVGASRGSQRLAGDSYAIAQQRYLDQQRKVEQRLEEEAVKVKSIADEEIERERERLELEYSSQQKEQNKVEPSNIDTSSVSRENPFLRKGCKQRALAGRSFRMPRHHDENNDEDFLDETPGALSKTPQDREYESDEDTDKLLTREYSRSEEVNIPELKEQKAIHTEKKKRGREVSIRHPEHPSQLIEGVLYRANYLGSTQLLSENKPSKITRMMQAQEAVTRIKAPLGESQPSVAVDLFISSEKLMVLNTNLQEIMMDHPLNTISYIADIGDVLVLMARRRISTAPSPAAHGDVQISTINSRSLSATDKVTEAASAGRRHTKIICHVFESDEAQIIAQSIGQAFQVAYMEFLRANGIDDPQLFKEMNYQEVLNQQEIYAEELQLFADKDMQKEVIVPKQRNEALGVVIVESGWGSMLPTAVLANMNPTGPAARCGQLNIGNQIMAVNGHSLVGLPLASCQQQVKACRSQTSVRLTVVSCPPVVEVLINRPDSKYQLGFSVQNGVICSLLRGGIAERGGIRVGHRIIEINGQSVVAVAHDKIVNMLATATGEIHLRTMPTSIFRLLTGQETPHYI